MDENNIVEQEAIISADEMSNDDLKMAVEEHLSRVRKQNLLIGAQSICSVILEKIYFYQSKPGKTTYRDYERLIKEIREFCETGMSRKMNSDGIISSSEENNNASKQD